MLYQSEISLAVAVKILFFFSQMKGAWHLAKWSSVDDSVSVLAGEHMPSTLTDTEVLSACITYYYTQEIFQVRINSNDSSATLGPAIYICFLRWVEHMCRETETGSRTAGDSRMQKGRKQLFPCLGHSAQHRFPVRRKFISAITWFLLYFGFSFFEDFLFKSYFAVWVNIKCQT